MKQKKSYITIALLIICICSINAIGFGYNVMEIRTTPEFGEGVFPTSLLYEFNIPVPDFINGSTTNCSFRLDNGMEYRKIQQDPKTGKHFHTTAPENMDIFDIYYMALFDEWDFTFGQGMFHSEFSEDDILRLWFTFGGRFENAYERLDWMSNADETTGLFHSSFNTLRNTFTGSLPGVPELEGKRSVHQLNLSFGLDMNYMKETNTTRNGIKNSLWYRCNPGSLQFLGDTSSDFHLIWNQLMISYTPLAIKQSNRNLTWFSIVLDNVTTYRFILGEKIPQYVMGGDIYGANGINTDNNIVNRTSITLYGPQIWKTDIFPYITGFLDIGYSWGNVLNSTTAERLSDLYMSTGIKIDFTIYNIAHIFYEYGYVFDNILDSAPTGKHRFGFSIGI